MKKSVLLAAVMLSGALGACDRSATPAKPDALAATAATDTDTVKKIETDFLAAIEAKDLPAIKANYASDAVMVLPEQAPLKGIDAIGADYDKFAADPAGKFDATNESTVVGADMAYSQGTYTVTYTNSKTKAVENGQGYYLVVYKKQDDGSWKIVQDVSSPTPTAS